MFFKFFLLRVFIFLLMFCSRFYYFYLCYVFIYIYCNTNFINMKLEYCYSKQRTFFLRRRNIVI
jgi:hypothetical protein